MSKISLTLVQAFYHLAKLGSFSAAAKELNLSYQSIANQVRRLETILGAELIVSEQGAKRVSLTPRGLTLYNVLYPELDVILERLNILMDNQRAVIRVGVPQGFFVHIFPKVITRFREKHPDIPLMFYERDTALPDLIRNGSIDVLISERYFGDPILSQRLLGSYRLKLVYPARWGPLDAHRDLIEQIRDRPFLTHEPGQTVRNLALDFLEVKGFRAAPFMSASSSTSIKHFIEEGHGFSILPSWCMDSNQSNLICVDLEELAAVQVYFGMASFLRDNIIVRDLYEDCLHVFSGIAPSPAL